MESKVLFCGIYTALTGGRCQESKVVKTSRNARGTNTAYCTHLAQLYVSAHPYH